MNEQTNVIGGSGGRSRNHVGQVVEGVYVDRLKLSWWCSSWDASQGHRGLGKGEKSGKGMTGCRSWLTGGRGITLWAGASDYRV